MSLELSAEAVGYMKRHGIRGLFERLLKELTVHKPSDPISFLIDRLKTKEGPKIIIAGAPASGKGTQCEKIVEAFGVAHISTGDLLRAAVAAGSELGKQAHKYMDVGDLVPDDVVIGLVKERLKEPDCMEKGWLLDGFPRTRPQALALQSSGVLADKFIYLDVPDDTVVERISNRRQVCVSNKWDHETVACLPSSLVI
jgi:adenylate kinase